MSDEAPDRLVDRDGNTVYLKSTPARECADEMLEKLEQLSDGEWFRAWLQGPIAALIRRAKGEQG